jgi:hypothetical protein
MKNLLGFLLCVVVASVVSPAHAQLFGIGKKKAPKPIPGHSSQASQVPAYEAYTTALPSVTEQMQGVAPLAVGVGDSHNGGQELVTERRQDLSGVDACAEIPGQKNFLNALEGAVRRSLPERQIASNSIIDEGYGLPGPENSEPVGLMSHPLCIQDESQIAAILGADFVPQVTVEEIDPVSKKMIKKQVADQNAIKALRDFSLASNEDRRRALAGDKQALESFSSRMTQMMGCLSYEESLKTAGKNEKADAAFQMAMDVVPGSKKYFTGSDGVARRPASVLVAEDRHGDFFLKLRKHKKDGTLTPEVLKELEGAYKPWPVVGMYQFNPKGGNTGPCIEQWNQIVDKPECKIDGSSPTDVMRALASPGQTFNTFCGVQKIVQAFNSQVNTKFVNDPVKGKTSTDPSNILPNGKLKAPKDRCVSLVARSGGGNIYSHFGPWRNSVKDNFGKLMGCVKNIK